MTSKTVADSAPGKTSAVWTSDMTTGSIILSAIPTLSASKTVADSAPGKTSAVWTSDMTTGSIIPSAIPTLLTSKTVADSTPGNTSAVWTSDITTESIIPSAIPTLSASKTVADSAPGNTSAEWTSDMTTGSIIPSAIPTLSARKTVADSTPGNTSAVWTSDMTTESIIPNAIPTLSASKTVADSTPGDTSAVWSSDMTTGSLVSSLTPALAGKTAATPTKLSISTSGIFTHAISSTGSLTYLMSSAAVTTPNSKRILIFGVSLTFGNEDFDEELYNKRSLRFIKKRKEVEDEIKNAYKDTDSFVSVTIIGFRRGSIVCDARLYFDNVSTSDISDLNTTLSEYGASNGFTVSEFVINAPDDDNDDDDEVILGLDWWQIGVIIAGILVFILTITVIVLCVSNYKIYKKSIMVPC